MTGSKWGYPFCSGHDILFRRKRDHCDVIFHPVFKLQFFYASEDLFSLSNVKTRADPDDMHCFVASYWCLHYSLKFLLQVTNIINLKGPIQSDKFGEWVV